MRQRHLDVRHARVAEAADRRPSTGRPEATTGRRSRWKDAAEQGRPEDQKTRDETWIATEKVGDKEVPVNRTDAIAFLGGAQNTNEECYLFQKAARLLGMAFVEHQARL